MPVSLRLDAFGGLRSGGTRGRTAVDAGGADAASIRRKRRRV